MWAELAFVLLNRFGIAKDFREKWLLRTSRRFSKRVGRLASHRADFIVGTDSASLEAFRIAKRAGVRCVLDLSHPHVLTCQRIEREDQKPCPEFASTFDTFALNADDVRYHVSEVNEADALIVASSFARESLLENGVDPERIHVVPYGVDTERFHPPAVDSALQSGPGGSLRILFVGRVGQRKGIGYLLRAVAELRRTREVTLRVVGNLWGEQEPYRPFSEDYLHLPRQPDSIYPQVYREADVFVLPSLIEGFGLVILEAMASGLPVIVTPNTGGRDIVTDGVEGFIVPIRDTSALKERLVFLQDNPDARRQMGMAARVKAEQYGWDRYYRGIADCLISIHDAMSV
jgi:glycosyltransferase involved in cell wall biosynthesis